MDRLVSEIKSIRKKLGDLWLKYYSGKENNIMQDLARVELSSQLLQMSEFRFFQLAYSRWYGRELPEKDMEHIFTEYMYRNEVPHWTRHLARNVLSLHFHGSLDPREFNSKCTAPQSRTETRGALNAKLLFLIYVIFYLILSGQIIFP